MPQRSRRPRRFRRQSPNGPEGYGPSRPRGASGPGGGGGGPGGPSGGNGLGHGQNGNPNNWHIDRKAPKNQPPLDGHWETYTWFRDMAEDHMVSCNPRWHYVIEEIEAEKTPLTLTKITTSNIIPGVNNVDLAHEMFSFLGTIFGAVVQKKRLRLAGGEKGNGMELWRRLYFDNASGGKLADLSGEKCFFQLPQM